jgi:hypothetical protein
VGGPVTIPKLYPKKDRTFFFFSEEFRIEKDPTDNNFNQAVPSLAEGCPEAPAGLEAVVAKMPREYEDLSGWGRTMPLPQNLRLPRLKRTLVRVGDHFEESSALGGTFEDQRKLFPGLLQVFGGKHDGKHDGVALHPLTDGLSVGHTNQNQVPPSASQHGFKLRGIFDQGRPIAHAHERGGHGYA